MTRSLLLAAMSVLSLTTGCATSQYISIAEADVSERIATLALVRSDGNSPDMDTAIKAAFLASGIVAQQTLTAGTRTSPDVDVVVEYTDQWRWDIAMYLRSVTVRMYDATTGNLWATAQWDSSAFHGFQDYKLVVKGLVDEMVVEMKRKSLAK